MSDKIRLSVKIQNGDIIITKTILDSDDHISEKYYLNDFGNWIKVLEGEQQVPVGVTVVVSWTSEVVS